MKKLGGVLTAIHTPFDASGALMLGALPPLLDFQRRAGIDGVVVCGTNGEGPSLSVDERKRLLDAVVAHRGDLLVVAATGAAAVSDALDLTRHAAGAGADAALVLPPFYFKDPAIEGVAAYFRQVLDAADLPILLYSIPQVTCVAVTDALLDLLAGHRRLAGLKDSAGVWERTSELIRAHRDLAVFPGADELVSRALDAGAVGVISGTANCFPELVAGVRDAHQSGGDVRAAQARLDSARGILQGFPPYAGSKCVLARRGLPRMSVRAPLVDLTSAQEADLLSRLTEAGVV